MKGLLLKELRSFVKARGFKKTAKVQRRGEYLTIPACPS